MAIVSEHKLPKMRKASKKGGSPLAGVAYDVTIYVYPDGHVNIANLADNSQNYVAANREEAIAALSRMVDLAYSAVDDQPEELRTRFAEDIEFGKETGDWTSFVATIAEIKDAGISDEIIISWAEEMKEEIRNGDVVSGGKIVGSQG